MSLNKKYLVKMFAIMVGIGVGLALIFGPIVQGIKGFFLEATVSQVWDVLGSLTIGQIIWMFFGLVFIRGLAELVPDFPTETEIKAVR